MNVARERVLRHVVAIGDEVNINFIAPRRTRSERMIRYVPMTQLHGGSMNSQQS